MSRASRSNPAPRPVAAGVPAAQPVAARTPAAPGGFVSTRLAEYEASRGALGPAWLEPMRRSAMERFVARGLPTTRDEEWRFTSVAPIERVPLRLAWPAADSPDPGTSHRPRDAETLSAIVPTAVRVDPEVVARALIDEAAFGMEASHRLVFVNGRLVKSLSLSRPLPRGTIFCGLAEAFGAHRGRIETHLTRIAPVNGHPFAALNTAFMADGAFLDVPEGAEIDEPFLVINLSSPSGASSLSHPRHLFLLGRGSRATVIESYAGTNCAIDPPRHMPGPSASAGSPFAEGAGAASAEIHPEGVYFTNAVTEILIGERASLRHYKLQDEAIRAFHLATIQARVGRDGILDSQSVSVGAALARNDLGARLEGEGAQATLNGLFIATRSQHIDNHTVIDHAVPHGTSREIYKGILDGRSRGVFDGRILVQKDAQKTDARQTNRNLLLSDHALINTKPQLEILADDVKCAHAATIGRLDELSLFYLRSRGLDLETARALLIRAFAGDVTQAMHLEPLRRRVEAHVARMLEARGGLGEPA
jgi:Fe-S cluster assembly protein SufD